MGKGPEKPELIFPQFTADYRGIFGEELAAIILYGSGAGHHYIPGKSDLNFLVILTDKGMEDLEKAMPVAAKWRKSNVATPLFMTRDYICTSLDAYPIEFLDMKLNHVAVYGEDVLAGLEINREYLRLQVERELRGKILLLRKRFLETEGKEKEARQLIRDSLPAFLSAFKALLWLMERDIPDDRREIVAAAAAAVGVAAEVFIDCLDIREGKDHFSKKGDVAAVFRKYLAEIDGLCRRIDKMTISPELEKR